MAPGLIDGHFEPVESIRVIHPAALLVFGARTPNYRYRARVVFFVVAAALAGGLPLNN
jgi:hypothetical protein